MTQRSDLIRKLFARNGGSRYGGEAVSQLEHALQAACSQSVPAPDRHW